MNRAPPPRPGAGRPGLTAWERFCFTFLTTVGSLALLNGAVAGGEWLAYGARWKDGGPEGLYAPRTEDRPRLLPGARLDGLLVAVHVNALGFRGPELATPRPPDGLRLWFVGGSTTFDIYAPDDAAAWPARTGRAVAAALGRPVEVVNAGIPSATLAHNRADLLRHHDTVQPDLLVVYAGPNDLREVVFDGPPPQPDRSRFDFAVWRLLLRLLPAHGALPASWAERSLQPAQRAMVVGALGQLVDAAERRDMKVVLATHALQAPPQATGAEARRLVGEGAALYQMHPEAVLAMFADYNASVRDLAEERGLVLADLRGAVGPDDRNWGDATHFDPDGAAVAADTAATAVLQALSAR